MMHKLLFKLHLRSSYPSYLTAIDGTKVPCNVIRTDMSSFPIKPVFTGGFSTLVDQSRIPGNEVNIFAVKGWHK